MVHCPHQIMKNCEKVVKFVPPEKTPLFCGAFLFHHGPLNQTAQMSKEIKQTVRLTHMKKVTCR